MSLVELTLSNVLGIVFSLILGYVGLKYLFRTTHPLATRAHGHILFGNGKDFQLQNYFKTLQQFPQYYGKFVDCYLGTKKLCLISDIDAIKELMMLRPKKLKRNTVDRYVSALVASASGLFSSRGERWQRLRRLTAPFFSHLNIKGKYGLIFEQMIDLIEKIKTSSATDSNKIYDMKSVSLSLTVHVITAVAFGLPPDNPVNEYFFSPLFLEDTSNIFVFGGAYRYFPYPHVFWKYSSKYPLEVAARKSSTRLNEKITEVIRYKRSLLVDGKSVGKPALIDSLLMKNQEDGDQLSDEELVANVITIYLAGSETTSNVINWIPFVFTQYPDILKNVREEVSPHFRGKTMDELKNLCDIDFIASKIPFCGVVTKELLRVYPTSTVLMFECENDNEEVVLSNGISLSPGDQWWVNIEGVLKDPEVYENPMAFRPERWLTTDEKKLQKMDYQFIEFGSGPRICPGILLANHELILSVALFAHFFDFELTCPPGEIHRVIGRTAFANKMPVKIKYRSEV
jgi:cytochrome P450